LATFWIGVEKEKNACSPVFIAMYDRGGGKEKKLSLDQMPQRRKNKKGKKRDRGNASYRFFGEEGKKKKRERKRGSLILPQRCIRAKRKKGRPEFCHLLPSKGGREEKEEGGADGG